MKNKNLDTPADIRKSDWSVGIHNDYYVKGKFHTFWLFTHPSGKFVKGEGRTDREALDKVRDKLRKRKW